jgi:FixJ family two-component response regulator
MANATTVFIVDDDPAVRDSLRWNQAALFWTSGCRA